MALTLFVVEWVVITGRDIRRDRSEFRLYASCGRGRGGGPGLFQCFDLKHYPFDLDRFVCLVKYSETTLSKKDTFPGNTPDSLLFKSSKVFELQACVLAWKLLLKTSRKEQARLVERT